MPKSNARSASLTSQESYSAVIIADLVAEVPVPVVKEETNLAYEGDTSPAMLTVLTEEINNKKNEAANLNKGITLSAGQLGQPESKLNDKAIQLNNLQLPPPARQGVGKIDDKPTGFKDMSIARKIAFGASFIPSIIFVLCFAIILPCKLPDCAERKWDKKFENTEITSNLVVPEDIIFLTFGNGSFIQSLDDSTGKHKEQIELTNKANYIKCGKIVNSETEDCIVRDEDGILYLLDTKNDSIKWERDFQKGVSSLPVILPDCDNNDVDEIAMPISNSQIQILYSEYIVSSVTLTDCDSIPTKLTVWTTNGTSSLVFVCEKNRKDLLIKIPQNIWCIYERKLQDRKVILNTRGIGVLQNSNLYPLNDGLLLWAEEEIILMNIDGSEKWKLNSKSHFETNRFIFIGRFQGGKDQVALLSSDVSSKLQVTLHDIENGKEMFSFSKENIEASDAVHVHGEEKDLLLVLLKKALQTFVTEAYARLNEASTTIISLLANEKINSRDITPDSFSHEVALMELNNDLITYTIAEIDDKRTAASITASQQKGNLLNIYLNTLLYNTTEVSKIVVKDWETLLMKKCSYPAK